jgi:uncharacterized membrane protein
VRQASENCIPRMEGDEFYSAKSDERAEARLTPQPQLGSRLAHIDWMRGLACVLMFQWHCYNSWLAPSVRNSSLYIWSQLGGTLPAPLFIFLSGISFALATEKLRERGAARSTIAKTTILRGAEIYGLGLLFRMQEFALGYPYSPWTDLLRVDVLNILGLGMMLMGVLCWLTASPTESASAASNQAPPPLEKQVARSRNRAIAGAILATVLVVTISPVLWTSGRLSWLPWPLESYINGVHTFGKPQPWLFPLFPWSAFAFAGLAVGFFLFSGAARRKQDLAFAGIGAAGLLAGVLSEIFDASPVRLYPPSMYDYWHTSPNFFLMRCGILLVILFLVYAWCRWGLAQKGFSPIIQLGKTSLLVYWVHIEFVYGRFSILPKGQCRIAKATGGLLVIFLAMLGLSILRTRWKRRPAKVLQTPPATVAAPAESG